MSEGSFTPWLYAVQNSLAMWSCVDHLAHHTYVCTYTHAQTRDSAGICSLWGHLTALQQQAMPVELDKPLLSAATYSDTSGGWNTLSRRSVGRQPVPVSWWCMPKHVFWAQSNSEQGSLPASDVLHAQLFEPSDTRPLGCHCVCPSTRCPFPKYLNLGTCNCDCLRQDCPYGSIFDLYTCQCESSLDTGRTRPLNSLQHVNVCGQRQATNRSGHRTTIKFFLTTS